MSCKTIAALDAQVAEFNRLTNRPLRAYEPEEGCMGGKANIGYAYARNMGEQDDNKCSIGVIINHGGGLMLIPDLAYLPAGDLLRTLRAKMRDPEWMLRYTLPRPS